MRVAQINISPSGSTGNIAKAIHRELLASGNESYVFYGIGTSSEKNFFRIGNYFSLHTHAVLSRNLGKQGYFSVGATVKLIRQLKKINPDIVHLHNVHGSYVNLPMLFGYLKKSGVQVVLTLHDCWLFTGKCPHFTAVGCEKWKDNCGNCPQLSQYPRSKVDTTVKSLQDKKKWLSGFGDKLRIVAVSNWLRDTARQSFLSQYSIETVYNGIDTNVFYPRDGKQVREKYHLDDRYVILGVASAWDTRKGLNEFIALSKQLTENEVIVLVGLTEAQIAHLPERIVGISRTENQNELAELYSAADVFVNASKEETFGLVTAEAMACGTPAIVYRSTACAEVINEVCIALESDGKHTIRQAIDWLKDKNDNCCQHIVDNFNIDKMVQGYKNVYEKGN